MTIQYLYITYMCVRGPSFSHAFIRIEGEAVNSLPAIDHQLVVSHQLVKVQLTVKNFVTIDHTNLMNNMMVISEHYQNPFVTMRWTMIEYHR
jgi:hypothetical protein